MEKLLEDWGFPELIPVFQDQEIDEEALLQISDSKILESIIPKIGPRIKFMAKLRDYQTISKSEILFIDDSKDEALNNFQNAVATTSQSCNYTSPSTSSLSSQVTSDDDDLVIADVKEAFQRATKRQLAFCGQTQFKKACRTVYNLNLEEFLKDSVPGNYIIHIYKEEKRLTRRTRNQLVSLLINGLMSSQDGAERLLPTDFEILAEKITELFPTESQATYYIPRIPGSKKTKPINAKGKLIDKYRNLCRSYNISNSNNSNSTEVGEKATDSNIDYGELENKKLWLSKFQEPWDLVLENWKSTFPLRKADRSSTIDQFISNWPILKHREAYTLIDGDFKELYPKCQISVHNQPHLWEKFFEKIKSVSVVDTCTLEFLSPLTDDINQDSKYAIQIAALPMLCPPKCRIRCGPKSQWKPSIAECQESLINLVPTCGNIQECITKRRNKLAELKLTGQPYIIVVGASFREITDSYLVIDSNFYRTYSVLHALDFTFKSFHSLNANYSKESEHIWLILEKSLFQIESSKTNIPSVLTIVKDISTH